MHRNCKVILFSGQATTAELQENAEQRVPLIMRVSSRVINLKLPDWQAHIPCLHAQDSTRAAVRSSAQCC